MEGKRNMGEGVLVVGIEVLPQIEEQVFFIGNGLVIFEVVVNL